MTRILITIQSGVETGHRTGLRLHSQTFIRPTWLRPGWRVEQKGAWGLIVEGSVPDTIDELVEHEDGLAPMAFRVLKEDERPAIQAERFTHGRPGGAA